MRTHVVRRHGIEFERLTDDAQAYRDFVLNVAKSVGEAAKGTTASESDAIQKIDAALATA